MLSDVEKEGTEDIVSWQPHGMAFRVHQTKDFTETVMKQYFHQTHYKSFQRQLHIYGFRRFSAGLDKGSYYHPMFVKGNMTASLRMTRCKIKGSLARVEVEEPDFYHQAEPVGSGVLIGSGVVGSGAVNTACLDHKWSDCRGLHVRSSSTFFVSLGPSRMVSSRSNTDPVLSKTVSLPTLPFSRARLSQKPQEQPKLRHNASCGGVTHQTQMMIQRDEIPTHNVVFGGDTNHTMTTMMLQNDFQPMLLSRITQNRRMSLLEEGDEVFFSGKKFFFVEKPSSLPKCQSSAEEQPRPM
jgi:hypothetical protein